MVFNEKITETIKMCRCCFMCRHACPTFLSTKLDSHTPRGYAINLSRINEGMTDWDEEGFERLFHCSQCGLCKELCEFSWPEDEMVMEGRREMIKAGKAPAEVSALEAQLFKSKGITNDLLDSRIFDQKDSDVLYIAGSALTNNQTKTIQNTAKLFEKAGLKYTAMKQEDTSAVVLDELGYAEQAGIKGGELCEAIKALNPKSVVTGCAHTYRYLKKNGDKLQKETAVIHITEYIASLLSDGKISLKAGGVQVMYHDPCQIGRDNGVYDAPRTIIEACAGQAPVEFFHNKAEAECCGAGASVYLTYPKIANGVAKKRLEQAADKKVGTVVTACPNCQYVFDTAVTAFEDGPEIIDILDFVMKHM